MTSRKCCPQTNAFENNPSFSSANNWLIFYGMSKLSEYLSLSSYYGDGLKTHGQEFTHGQRCCFPYQTRCTRRSSPALGARIAHKEGGIGPGRVGMGCKAPACIIPGGQRNPPRCSGALFTIALGSIGSPVPRAPTTYVPRTRGARAPGDNGPAKHISPAGPREPRPFNCRILIGSAGRRRTSPPIGRHCRLREALLAPALPLSSLAASTRAGVFDARSSRCPAVIYCPPGPCGPAPVAVETCPLGKLLAPRLGHSLTPN